VLAVVLCALTACAPTLSKPRGGAHLDALADAERHQHHGRLAEAAAAYEKAALAAERRVDRDEALYRESRVWARMGDFERAIAVCDLLASSQPSSRRTLRARLDAGRYRLELGQAEVAERSLLSLLHDAPESGEAKSALRSLLALRAGEADHGAALAYVRSLRAQVPRGHLDEALAFREAELLLALGQREQTQAALLRQIEQYAYPTGHYWDEALALLAELSLQAGEPRAAIAYLQRMLAEHESAFLIGSYTRALFPTSALRVARIYRDQLNDTDAAIAAYREARAAFPKSRIVDDALAEEGELELSRGERERGCTLLREVTTRFEVGAARRRALSRIAADCAASE
jgi:tetratricopeptide (TPR) repeat protein